MKRLRFLLPLLGIVAALGVATVQAATSSTTQNVSFSVPSSISIASNGDVSAGSITTQTQANGSFTINSTDPAGFSLTTQANSATTTESGCGSPSSSFSANKIDVFATGPVSGQSSGSGGSGGTLTYSTSPQSPLTGITAVGSNMQLTVGYIIHADQIMPNSTGCSYVFGTTWTVSGN